MVNKFTGSAIATSYHLAPALMETAQCFKTTVVNSLHVFG